MSDSRDSEESEPISRPQKGSTATTDLINRNPCTRRRRRIAVDCERTRQFLRTLFPRELASERGVPNSPIFVSENGIVTVSAAAVSALSEFVLKAVINSSVPMYGIKFRESDRVWSLDLKTYFRKRKRKAFGSAGPSASKRKLLFPSEFGESKQAMLSLPGRTGDISPEGNSCKHVVFESSFVESNAFFPNFSVVEFEGVRDGDGVGMEIVLPVESFGLSDTSLVNRGLVEIETDSKLRKSTRVEKLGISPMEACFGVSHHRARLTMENVEVEHREGISRNKGDNDCFGSRSAVNAITMNKVKLASEVETGANFQEQASKPFGKSIGTYKVFPSKRVLTESSAHNKDINIPEKSDWKFLCLEHEPEGIAKHNVHGKENTVRVTAVSPNKQVEQKNLPHFNNFIIEDEEGSGGYGTVYRARRKSDGKKCAIKCPHARAHKNHVNNEVKILQRFGGRNCIVKYEGSLKYGDTECVVLEHVDHDRPEVLKKEIDVDQLQWYGYCLFRALAFLHKQGIVHKDVKAGNFLFSRKLSKGVLVDFNLSMDLHQKYADGSKSKPSFCASISHPPPPRPKPSRSTKDKAVTGVRSTINLLETAANEKLVCEHKSIKKSANSISLASSSIVSANQRKGRGVFDASGLNTTKDQTSTKTSSAERAREPLPSLGRKELISLVQDAMQSPNHDAIKNPVSQRKRIAAPPRKLLHTSPMPLYSQGVPVAGPGVMRSKGDGKQKREGPCFGTKGFRAPEVLFRSLHQGPKIDVWSAGVTLLYLMSGKLPFTGEPEQNIKEIAKLKGSEDLWEVAKLHDRESSFPMELLDVRALPSVGLESWCKTHTRRPEFLNHVPISLFDLIDKCLTVNPRLRISAEEALRHDFFAPCHESMWKRWTLEHEMSAQNTRVFE